MALVTYLHNNEYGGAELPALVSKITKQKIPIDLTYMGHIFMGSLAHYVRVQLNDLLSINVSQVASTIVAWLRPYTDTELTEQDDDDDEDGAAIHGDEAQKAEPPTAAVFDPCSSRLSSSTLSADDRLKLASRVFENKIAPLFVNA